MTDFEILKEEINNQWFRLYQGGPVHDITQLKNRIGYIADDRDCWVFNAKVADKEIDRLKEKLNDDRP